MKISFAITVCNELEEIKRLVPFLAEKKRHEDEIVILYDKKNGNQEVFDFLIPYNGLNNIGIFAGEFKGNFAELKNILNSYCTGDYIYQLDADEMISEYMVQNVSTILEMNPEVDLIFVPRINTVNGLTQEDINKWNWAVNDKGWVNFPDWQGRIHRQKLNWYGKVHERIIGGQNFASLPTDEEYCLIHNKDIERQRKQNNFYNAL
jgi:Glycosyl transferase family 2